MKSELNTNKKFFRIPELADMLGLSVSTIRGLVSQRKVPFMKLGGSILFNPDEVINYILSKRIKTADEVQAEADSYLNSGKGGASR